MILKYTFKKSSICNTGYLTLLQFHTAASGETTGEHVVGEKEEIKGGLQWAEAGRLIKVKTVKHC